MLSEGVYNATIAGQGFTISKNGTNGFWLRCQLHDVSDNNGDAVERTIYWYLTDATIDFVIEKLGRLGFVPESFTELDPLHPNYHAYAGQQVELYCRHEVYDGKAREKWDFSNPEFAGPKSLEPTEIRKLDALFGRKLKAGKGAVKPVGNGAPKADSKVPSKVPSKATPARAPAVVTEPAVNADDIPF